MAVWDREMIQARLAAMRVADPDLKRHGAGGHGYRLGAVLTADRVSAFESEHSVTLPPEYRSFVLTVADGGAGPDYGVYPIDGQGIYPADQDRPFPPGYLAMPFPHACAWTPAPPGASSAAMSEADYFDPRWTAGSMIVSHLGCGAYHRLVVTGAARGQIWLDDRASDGGITPGQDFRSWYLNWLNALG